MGDKTIRIAAPPDKVFAQITKPFEDAEPGTMKVGDTFTMPGQDNVFTITRIDAPSRFGLSWTYAENGYVAEYSVLPDDAGSLVRLDLELRDTKSLLGMLLSPLMEGRQEGQVLEQLKASVEGAAVSS